MQPEVANVHTITVYITIQTSLNFAASSFSCKIILISLGSSLSVESLLTHVFEVSCTVTIEDGVVYYQIVRGLECISVKYIAFYICYWLCIL